MLMIWKKNWSTCIIHLLMLEFADRLDCTKNNFYTFIYIHIYKKWRRKFCCYDVGWCPDLLRYCVLKSKIAYQVTVIFLITLNMKVITKITYNQTQTRYQTFFTITGFIITAIKLIFLIWCFKSGVANSFTYAGRLVTKTSSRAIYVSKIHCGSQ